jgi:hypothetical protein
MDAVDLAAPKHGRTMFRRALPYLAVVAVVCAVGLAQFLRLSVIALFPIGGAAVAYLMFRFVFPGLMGSNLGAKAMAERVQSVRNSGPILASGNPGGRMSGVNFSIGFLAVKVRPGGILLEPRFMGGRAILSSEITGVRAAHGLLSWAIDVDHAGLGCDSPLRLWTSSGGQIAEAIRSVAGLSTGPFHPRRRRLWIPGIPSESGRPERKGAGAKRT